jgi:hypothetical protein
MSDHDDRPAQRGTPFEEGDPVPEFRSHIPDTTERPRVWTTYYCHGCNGEPGPIYEGDCSRCGEQVERIEVIPRSQLLRVEAERDDYKMRLREAQASRDASRERFTRAEVEIGRLREALGHIAAATNPEGLPSGPGAEKVLAMLGRIHDRARSALTPQQDTDEE